MANLKISVIKSVSRQQQYLYN